MTPEEVDAVIEDAEWATALASFNPPLSKCGVTPPGQIAGGFIFCDLLAGHSSKIKHRNRHTGYTWWA